MDDNRVTYKSLGSGAWSRQVHKGMFDATLSKILILQCLQLTSKKELVFDVAFGKYEEGVTVVLYDGPKENREKFTINKDGTISPLKAPNLVIGMIATALQHDRSAYE